MHITYDLPVAIDDVVEVRQQLTGRICRTGMPRPDYLSERCRGEIFLKFESMRCAGSFKVYGAFNKLSSPTDTEKHKGVVTCSADNHAQRVSLSCVILGINGEVVMPKGVPKFKVAAMYNYFAKVVLHDSNFNDTIVEVNEIVEMEGHILIPPYDNLKVTAGQGTIGLGITEDLYDVDNVIMPISGGGLITGITVAIRSINLTIHAIDVQSENVHGMVISLHSEEIITHRITGTPADGCNVSRPDNLIYEVVRELVDDTALVNGDEIRDSMIALAQRNKVVTGGAGTLVCAILLNGKLDQYIQNRKIVNIISGGNIDPSRVSQVIDFVDI